MTARLFAVWKPSSVAWILCAVVEALWLVGLVVQWSLFRSRVVPVLATAYDSTGQSLSTMLQVGYRSTQWLEIPQILLGLVLVPLAIRGSGWMRWTVAVVALGVVVAQIASGIVFLRTCMELAALV